MDGGTQACDSAVAYKRQLECVLQVMDTSGDSLKHAWPVVIGIINDAMTTQRPTPNATTVKNAFDCIKLIVNDFVEIVPIQCYPLLMSTISRFGEKDVDVNICLTAIGLLWNVSDYLSRHKAKVHQDLATLPTVSETGVGDGPTPPSFSLLFLFIFLSCLPFFTFG
jgi:hypothetical protein